MPSSFRASVTTIRDNHGRFALPFVEEKVDGILELGRDTPVALGGQKDESVIAGDVPTPYAGVLVRVVFRRLDSIGNTGLVKNGKIEVFQIDEINGGAGS